MKGKRWLTVGTLIGVLALAGCGGDDDDNGTTTAAKSEGGSEITGSVTAWIMDPGSPALQKVFNGYATDFEAEHAGTDVSIEFVPWAQAHDKFVTAIAGGEVPDVAEMGTTWTPEFADQGAFEPVDKAATGDYVSSLVDAATLDDEVWGKPWYAGVRSLIYRKDVLEKAGVEPPTTWDELKSASQAIKEKGGGIYPIALNGLTEHYYLPMIWQAGGEIATQEGESWKAALNSPEGIEAIDFYASFYKEGLTPKASIGWEESPDALEAFINGDIAMMLGGGWSFNSIIDTKPELEKKLGAVPAPAGPSGENTAFAGGSHLVVFKESENVDAANAFVDFMLEPENLNKFTGEIGFLPGTVSGIEGSGELEDPIRKTWAEQLLNASNVYPPSPRWGALEGANIFDGEIQSVMRGKATAEEAAKSLAEKMDEEFAG